MLRALPALPVPHHSWPFCHLESSCTHAFMASALPWSDPRVMREFARVTHSLSAYSGLEFYSNLSSAEIDTMWERLVVGVNGTDATIAVQLEIGVKTGVLASPVRPSDTMVAALTNATRAVARANAKLGTDARIGTVMVDQEGWGTANLTQITLNNDVVYAHCVSVLGADVDIQYYGRGMHTLNDDSASGFWTPDWYSLDEVDNRQLSVSLYSVVEKMAMRIDYATTAAAMVRAAAACRAATPARAMCPDHVVPWIALGAAYEPTLDAAGKLGSTFAIPSAYPLAASWELGRDVCNSSLREVSMNSISFRLHRLPPTLWGLRVFLQSRETRAHPFQTLCRTFLGSLFF